MKFSAKEIIHGNILKQIPGDVVVSLIELRDRLNVLGELLKEKGWNVPRRFTCTYRDEEHNKRVGGAKMSNHLTGRAADILDSDGKLKAALKQYPELLEKAGLYMEDGAYTNGWCHLQINPPKSGKRVFIP